MSRSWIPLLLIFTALYALTVSQVRQLPAVHQQDYMRVAVPPPVQVLLTGGDRFLAANIATLRAIMVGTDKLDPDTIHVLAQVQADAAQMNPAQLDNYYLAAAILPWYGEVEPTQYILQRATDARPKDILPPFFMGFNRQYFLNDYVGAGHALDIAAQRADGPNRMALQRIAAQWYEKGDDPNIAIQTLTSMKNGVRDANFKQYLDLRIARVQGLQELRLAAAHYQHDLGHPPKTLQDLADTRYIYALPKDPIGLGYTLDDKGRPIFVIRKFKLN